MAQGHYDRHDDTYYCDIEGCGQPFRHLDTVREHIKVVHGFKRSTIEDADADPANQKENDLDVGQILALHDALPKDTIENFVPVTVPMKGQRRRFTIRVAANSDSLKTDVLPFNLNLPPDTSMSPEAVEQPSPDSALATLFGALRELQSQFVYFQDSMQHDIMALVTLATYFREIFRTFPFLGFVSAERGWGKTTATKATIYPGYNGIFFAIPSEASFFRLVEDAHGVVGVDQVDDVFANPDQNRELLALLDAAHQKGIVVPRCEKDAQGKQLVFFYEPFAVVVYNGTELIPGSLLSRSIIMKMTECAGRKQLRKNPIPKDFQCIRDQLYLWRLRHWSEVQATYDQLITQGLLLDRNEDIYLPLLTLAKLIDEPLFQAVRTYAQRQYVQDRARRLNTWLQALVELLPQFVGETEIVQIRDAMNLRLIEMGELELKRDGEPKKSLGSRWIVKNLESLGFERCSRGPTGRTRYLVLKERVDELLHIYADLITSTTVSLSCTASVASESSAEGVERLASLKGQTMLPSDSSESSENRLGSPQPSPPEAPEDSLKIQNRAARPSTSAPEDTEDSEAPGGVQAPVARPDQGGELRELLRFARTMAAEHPKHEVEFHHLLTRCQLDWGGGYTAEDLTAAIDHLKDKGKLMEVRPGRYRIV